MNPAIEKLSHIAGALTPAVEETQRHIDLLESEINLLKAKLANAQSEAAECAFKYKEMRQTFWRINPRNDYQYRRDTKAIVLEISPFVWKELTEAERVKAVFELLWDGTRQLLTKDSPDKIFQDFMTHHPGA